MSCGELNLNIYQGSTVPNKFRNESGSDVATQYLNLSHFRYIRTPLIKGGIWCKCSWMQSFKQEIVSVLKMNPWLKCISQVSKRWQRKRRHKLQLKFLIHFISSRNKFKILLSPPNNKCNIDSFTSPCRNRLYLIWILTNNELNELNRLLKSEIWIFHLSEKRQLKFVSEIRFCDWLACNQETIQRGLKS